MWYLLSYIVPPVACAVVLASILYWFARLAAGRRYRLHVNTRLYRYVRRARARKWQCRKCGHRGAGPAPMGPVCQACWLALDEYLQEVA